MQSVSLSVFWRFSKVVFFLFLIAACVQSHIGFFWDILHKHGEAVMSWAAACRQVTQQFVFNISSWPRSWAAGGRLFISPMKDLKPHLLRRSPPRSPPLLDAPFRKCTPVGSEGTAYGMRGAAGRGPQEVHPQRCGGERSTRRTACGATWTHTAL